MQITQGNRPLNNVDYYPLPNGYADVYLHKNQRTETIENQTVYIADEVYFRITQDVTKEQIESNFEYFWNDAEKGIPPTPTQAEPTQEERLKALESAMLEIILGGAV